MSMNGADIQVERGNFTRIHNAILEALITAHLGAAEYACVLYLIRVTYGYLRKETDISLNEWVDGTKLDKRNVSRALRSLVDQKIVLKTSAGTGRGHRTTWGFNKYTEQWQVGQKGVVSTPISDDKGCEYDALSDNKGCQNMHIKGVKNGSEYTSLKKVKKAEQQLPAAPAKSPFIAAYERVWGILVPSPYIADEIAEWEKRVTLEAWCYGLQECADARKIGQMKYLRSILRRVEQEGLPKPKIQPPSPDLGFSLEEII